MDDAYQVGSGSSVVRVNQVSNAIPLGLARYVSQPCGGYSATLNHQNTRRWRQVRRRFCRKEARRDNATAENACALVERADAAQGTASIAGRS